MSNRYCGVSSLRLEPLEARIMLNAYTGGAVLVNEWANPYGGNALVSVYDASGPVDINPKDISVVFGKKDVVKSITLAGNQPMEGLVLVVSGSKSVGSINDVRTNPGTIAEVSSNSSVDSISVSSGIGGYSDGTLPATSIVIDGYISKITVGGDVESAITIGDFDSKGFSLRNLSINGSLSGNLSATGSVDKIVIGDNLTSDISIGGALSSLTVKNGGFYGSLTTGGPVDKIAVSDAGFFGGNITINGADKKGISLGKLCTKGDIWLTNIQLAGELDALYANGFYYGSLTADAARKITLRSDLSSTINVDGSIQALSVGRDMYANIQAGSINRLTVAGSVWGSNVIISGAGTNGFGLGTATIAGEFGSSLISVAGSVKSFSLGYWAVGGTLAVGVDSGSDGFFSGDETGAGGTIRSFKLSSFDNIDPNDGGQAFGMIADGYGEILVGGVNIYPGSIPYSNGDFRILEV